MLCTELDLDPKIKVVLHQFISFVRSGGALEGELRQRSVARRSQDDDDGRTLIGSA